MTRNLRGLLLKHHKPLHDSWAALDEKFDPEVETAINKLNMLLRAHGQHRKSESISGNNTATILNTFTSVIEPQNFRIYHLADEILCSGYDSLLPWQGMRAHYAQAHDSLALLLQDIGGILSPLVRREEQRFSKKGEIDNLVEEFLSTAQWAYKTVQVGLGAARTLDVEIGSICATITQAAQLQWRVLAQDNSLLFHQFVPDGDTDDVIEVWLSWPPTTEAISDLTDATSIVWGSRFRNR